jgi:membrane protease YdiL (CAAX protease family)
VRPIRSLLIYIACIFIGAALLAPWLYWAAQWAGEHSTALKGLSAQPFHRYLNRCLLGLALLGMWPFLRSLRIDSWSAAGLPNISGQGRKLAGGLALGFASLAVVAALALATGARSFKADLSAADFLWKLLSATLSAAVVALLEELLFRGALFGGLRKAHPWTVALAISSLVYALVHFLQKPAPPGDITWSSGLALLPVMLHGFSEVHMLVPAFFTLFCAGVILGMAYQQTGNLYLSIGLHAGWIFWLKFYGAVTVASPAHSQAFWGSAKLIDGWLALGVLGAMLAATWFIPWTERERRAVPALAAKP